MVVSIKSNLVQLSKQKLKFNPEKARTFDCTKEISKKTLANF